MLIKKDAFAGVLFFVACYYYATDIDFERMVWYNYNKKYVYIGGVLCLMI